MSQAGGGTNINLSSNFQYPVFLTVQEREESEVYRELKRNTAESVWSPRQRCNIPAQAPKWSLQEEDAIVLLIRAGVKFKKSWDSYLRHSLLNRSEAATSGVYYLLKKRDADLVESGDDRSWSDSINERSGATFMERAVRLLRQIRSGNLATPMQISTIQSEQEYHRSQRKRSFDSLTEDESVGSAEDCGDYVQPSHTLGVQHAHAEEPLRSPPSVLVGTHELSALFRALAKGQSFVSANGAVY